MQRCHAHLAASFVSNGSFACCMPAWSCWLFECARSNVLLRAVHAVHLCYCVRSLALCPNPAAATKACRPSSGYQTTNATAARGPCFRQSPRSMLCSSRRSSCGSSCAVRWRRNRNCRTPSSNCKQPSVCHTVHVGWPIRSPCLNFVQPTWSVLAYCGLSSQHLLGRHDSLQWPGLHASSI
jgi:hypothetical protein